MLLDFTGYACVNCRKMEMNIWFHLSILEKLQQQFVIASLHVDDKRKLKSPEISPYSGKELKTIGDKWLDFEMSKFQNSTQPLYVILDHQGDALVETASYSTHNSTDRFETWLQSGLDAFKANH